MLATIAPRQFNRNGVELAEALGNFGLTQPKLLVYFTNVPAMYFSARSTSTAAARPTECGPRGGGGAHPPVQPTRNHSTGSTINLTS